MLHGTRNTHDKAFLDIRGDHPGGNESWFEPGRNDTVEEFGNCWSQCDRPVIWQFLLSPFVKEDCRAVPPYLWACLLVDEFVEKLGKQGGIQGS